MITEKTRQTTKLKKSIPTRDGISENILQLIGNTPMLKLTKLTQGVECDVLAKLEFLNIGGSIKDRIGISMIEAAEAQGIIQPGYTIVEPTSGNTGLGLAIAAIAKGYKMIFTLPDKMSREKIDLLRAFGAKVIITPTNVAPDHPANYVKVAERIAKETPNSFMPNQYFNKANPETHYKTTGPEIWKQTKGKIDVLVATMGTGGTISGIAKYLKEKNPNIRIVGVDPEGSLYHHEFYGTKDKADVHSYKVEGIGEDFLPSTLNLKIVDEIITVNDKNSFLTARELVKKKGCLLVARQVPPCSQRYKWQRRWEKARLWWLFYQTLEEIILTSFTPMTGMIENGFLSGGEEKIAIRDILRTKSNKLGLLYVDPENGISKAIDLMKVHGVSQLPVIKDDVQVGSIREITVMKKLSDRASSSKQTVKDFLEPPLPAVNIEERIVAPLNLLKNQNALAVLEDNKIIDIITTIDVINYLLSR